MITKEKISASIEEYQTKVKLTGNKLDKLRMELKEMLSNK